MSRQLAQRAGRTARTARLRRVGDIIRRPPGRPTGKSDRRTLLLDAALVLFAEQGVQNTTLRMIADQVGLTPAMAHYYFNSREQLIDALVEERLLPICTSIEETFGAECDDPMTVISNFVARLLEAAARYPWLAPLWLREGLSEGGALTEQIERRLAETKREKASRCIERWKQQGKLGETIEPELVFTSIVALVLLPLAAGAKGTYSVSPDRLARHVVTLLGRGMF
ncbi:TetR/AcrR family transcriptional regulator [Bradyrhizobium sp. ARR65]|uniref:TetR/AcrR family transcriptional regulator n=1 Tax=Bradyrhizobium sp. ARR65 TaxID=1040989 RepID=UPI0018DB4358|nr:TetR/AcrR family transcriptional regulator [Bradyrhizobium sp. ARR65]